MTVIGIQYWRKNIHALFGISSGRKPQVGKDDKDSGLLRSFVRRDHRRRSGGSN
ncbi:MAG TPA: hypothetical protein DEB17_08385 [Chlorobaculum sp.]|uniref:Uncharacterized protein n=1 Tax=Chlorobaculum tepidum (strain ATCC 49652 / DSM 12025 / NBRC 103806 / TLS) TaxID=194439 RepID=Q8KDB6_CHLTE|nr:hypothetical protein CT1138 [Chlorobaculum tepidum TLS]HBU23989.1 hypothetical protein [Chlorobaculum sp.]